MRISKEIKEKLSKGEVTLDMLGMAAFSYNKRAKNMRNQERKWRKYYRNNYYSFDFHNTEERYKEKKEEYYRRKDECLSFVEPDSIHIVERERSYVSWNKDEYDYDYEYEVFEEYFLLYKIGKYRFHHPITPLEFEKYKNKLPTENIDELLTEGEDTDKLMSVQTADKIRNGLVSGEYKLVKNF